MLNKKKLEMLNKIANKKLGKSKEVSKDSSLLDLIKLVIKIQFGGTFMFLFFKFLLIGIMMVFLMFAAAGVVQFFEEDNKTLEDMDINWENYQCTCIHLTPEEIAKVKAGGQVEVDGSNGSGINISGGSVTTGAHGKKITDAQLNPYDLPLYDGLTMDAAQLGCDSWEVDISSHPNTQVVEGNKKHVHTYMGTHTLKNEDSEQYKLKVAPDRVNLDNTALLTIDGRLVVAVGTAISMNPSGGDTYSWDLCGRYIDIVFDDGTVLAAMVGDTKRDSETVDKIMHPDGSIVEFWTNTDASGAYSSTENILKNSLGIDSYSSLSGVNKPISKIITYNADYYKGNQYKKWFTEVTAQLNSNTTNNTTASFGQTGTGTTQSNSGNSGLSTNTSTDYDLNSFSVANNANLMVVVEGTGGSNCAVKAFEKLGSTWVERVNTIGVLGENGMSANRTEGDKTTPVGVFKMNTPFGQADALDGFPSDYIKVDEHDYWSSETSTYNKYVRDETRVVAGEAIGTSGFAEIYDYAIDSGYNISGTAKKGSALFLHCTKANKVSTSGCVAIPKDEMATIMKLFAKYENNSYIIQGIKGSVKDLYNAYNDAGLSPSSSSTTNGSTGDSGTSGVQQNTLKYSNGEKISLDSSWEYASDSKINSGAATYYTATGDTRKNICISVNAGHGCAGGSSVNTKCHPDGTPKVTGGTTEAGKVEAPAISDGMTFNDNTSEAVVNLKVAKMLKSELLSMGYDVLMIRDSDDEQLDNIARTVISNNVADAHIAIHFDSSENDKGVFYMSVATGVKNMEPVKSHWQEHNALGENLIAGLVLNGAKKFSSGSMEMDLTQTSYSTIPSVDIELGDKVTDYSDASCSIFAKGIAAGVEEFFKTHTPSNQAKRGISNISNESGNTNSGVTNGGVVNKNLNNLRTECRMKDEGICGCYVSDPNCMCHIYGGEDGVIGTDDDGKINTGVDEQQNISGLTTEQSQVINAAKEVMQIYLETLKVKYPSYYEAGWTSTTSPTFGLKDCGPWYGYASGYHEPIINGISYNGARWDCSSYVNGVLIRLGAPWAKVGNSTSTMLGKNFMDSVIADDRFILLKYDINILQPGDIVLKNKHTEILYKMIDVNTSTVSRYGWGSTGAVRTAYDATTRTLLNEPTILSYSYYNNGARADEYIIRYVGSGGAGK